MSGIWLGFLLDQILAYIFMFSSDGLGMKDVLAKSGDNFKLGKTRNVLEERVRV